MSYVVFRWPYQFGVSASGGMTCIEGLCMCDPGYRCAGPIDEEMGCLAECVLEAQPGINVSEIIKRACLEGGGIWDESLQDCLVAPEPAPIAVPAPEPEPVPVPVPAPAPSAPAPVPGTGPIQAGVSSPPRKISPAAVAGATAGAAALLLLMVL